MRWIDSLLRAFCLWLVLDCPIRMGRLAPPLFAYGIGATAYRRIDDHEDRVVLGLEDEDVE